MSVDISQSHTKVKGTFLGTLYIVYSLEQFPKIFAVQLFRLCPYFPLCYMLKTIPSVSRWRQQVREVAGHQWKPGYTWIHCWDVSELSSLRYDERIVSVSKQQCENQKYRRHSIRFDVLFDSMSTNFHFTNASLVAHNHDRRVAAISWDNWSLVASHAVSVGVETLIVFLSSRHRPRENRLTWVCVGLLSFLRVLNRA